MKHIRLILIFFTISAFVFSLVWLGPISDKASAPATVKTYKDIPGVTEEEILAIEALKSANNEFTYGSILATEAFILQDGTYEGFTSKLCALLSELFETSFVQVICEWDELMEGLESHTIDFTGELTATEERMQIYGMTSPIAERLLRIFTHMDSNYIQTEEDVNGLRIGFLEGSITADSIKKVYPISFTRVDVDNYQMAARMIANGEIDAFVDEAVADPSFDEYDFIRSTVFFPMIHESVSMTTANDELYPIISVVNKYIAAGGVNELYEFYKDGDFEYVKYKLHKSFTDEEKAYLDNLAAQGASVAAAFEHDNYPVSFYNEKDAEFQGIAIDVLSEISELTGIRFEPATAKGDIWADILERAKDGDIHMLSQLLRSKEKEDQFIWSAAPYARSRYAILSKSDYPNLTSYQVGRSSVGVMKKSGYEDVYREMFPENNNLIEYDTIEECLDALEKGEIDLLMASEYTLLSQTNYREKPGLKINIIFNAPMESYFGFSNNEKILCSIIDKAQQHVETDVIEISWTGRVFDYSKKLAEERARYMTIFVCFLSFMLIATAFLLIKNIRLSKKMEKLANHDALTGILNRRYFMELCPSQIERSLRAGSQCYIIMFDLDHFKAVNDTYGHLAGDAVLQETTRRARQAIRSYDLLGRYGGEEFLIYMPDMDKEDVIHTTERIRISICETPVEFEGILIPISASFGIAQASPLNDMDTAIKYSDEALYKAKESGRNRVVFYGD